MTQDDDRERLVNYLSREIRDHKVLDAMRRVRRELFVPPGERLRAYEDRPLPIGEGQTISQPFIVALMTQALNLSGTEKVLELGAGSGYQTAILAELAREVITVERVESLADHAQETLRNLGYANVKVYLAEESLGWPAEAPYEAIMVTAGAPQVPPNLLEQLTVGGRMVIPVGSMWDQDLLLVIKKKKGFTANSLTPCRFVPLIGEGAWSDD